MDGNNRVCPSSARALSVPRMAGERLEITAGPAAGTSLELGESLELGRAASGEGNPGGDDELSRQHARLTRAPDGGLVIEDLGSTNGTWVNRIRIAAATPLKPGDE